MSCNPNGVKISGSPATTSSLETHTGSPQQKSSPKHRGVRVTFDSSSLSSSPKSRSSREKDEEEFRTNVAQSLGLGGPIPAQTSCGIQMEKPMDKDTDNTKGVDRNNGMSEDAIVPADDENKAHHTDKGLKIDNDIDVIYDGMSEYAAYYIEPPPEYQDVLDQPVICEPPPKQDEAESSPKPSDVSSRRELREPDGASGTSSPSVNPPKDTTGGKDPSFQRNGKEQSKKNENIQFPNKTSGAGIEESLTPGVKHENNESDIANTPKDKTDEIPSTNIAVACLVTLCFNLPFGILAVYFSLMATKAYRDGKTKQGAKKARISIYISLFSIVLTVLIVMILVLIRAMEGQARQRRYTTKTSVSL